MMRYVVVVAAALVVTAAAVAAAPSGISQQSIGGIKLGMTQAQVKAILGASKTRPGTADNPGQPEGWTALVSAKKKLSVFFEQGSDKAVMVTTWNPAYRTAEGARPCMKISKLKEIYGKRLKPSKHNLVGGKAFAYTLGKRLMFGADAAPPTPSKTVTAIGLYDGTAGMQGYAGFVTDSEQNC